MEKTNTPQYKTKYLNHFRDFDPKKEKEELKNVKRSFNKNEDDIHDLPNINKPHFNNVTKTMQFLSKDEIKDKIEAIDDMEEKKESVTLLRFGQMLNENKLEKEIKRLQDKLGKLLDEEPETKEEKEELKKLIKETEEEINTIKIDLKS